MAARKQKPSGSDLSEPDEPADKPKAKRRPKAKPISENPAASLSLLRRARRR